MGKETGSGQQVIVNLDYYTVNTSYISLRSSGSYHYSWLQRIQFVGTVVAQHRIIRTELTYINTETISLLSIHTY